MLIDINKIKVEKRIRKDYGDIEGLANSIKELGLLNPPVVTPEYILVAGERRLRALKHLDYQQIMVNVMTFDDYEQKLKAEVHENEQRKEFTFSERLDWARELEQIERSKAEQRRNSSLKQNQSDSRNSDIRDVGRSADKVADQTGFGSRDTYTKAKFIGENADPEVIKQLDEEQISINAAYQRIKKEMEDAKREAQQERRAKEALLELQEHQQEIVPEHVKDKLESLKSDLQKEKETSERIRSKLFEIEDQKGQYERKLKAMEAYQQSEQAELDKLKRHKEKLELEAHISISELQIGIHKFIEDYSPNVFLQGAVASSTFMMRDDLLDSIIALEEFTKKLREMLYSKVEVIDENVIKLN